MPIIMQKNIKLSDYSTFKIGGEAKFFVEVENKDELLEAIGYAADNKLEYFILGSGSNVLFGDSGFEGLVIKIGDKSHEIDGNFIECGAGLLLSEAVAIAKDNGLSGLEWAAGIPGTIGGGIRGNCGAFGGSMGDVISEVRAYKIDESRIMNYGPNECEFFYRDSIFKRNQNLIIVSARINLKKGNIEEIEDKMKSMLEQRLEKMPKGWAGCAGSFFKNPEVKDEKLREKFERQTGRNCVDGRIPAGWLVYEAGLTGKKIGNVMVGEKHGNFILNMGGGTAEEILMLVSIIKSKVRNEFGVQLEEEVKYVI